MATYRLLGRRSFVVAAAALILATCAGCSTTHLAEVIQALGSDTNSVSVTVSTPWGRADFRRNQVGP